MEPQAFPVQLVLRVIRDSLAQLVPPAPLDTVNQEPQE